MFTITHPADVTGTRFVAGKAVQFEDGQAATRSTVIAHAARGRGWAVTECDCDGCTDGDDEDPIMVRTGSEAAPEGEPVGQWATADEVARASE